MKLISVKALISGILIIIFLYFLCQYLGYLFIESLTNGNELLAEKINRNPVLYPSALIFMIIIFIFETIIPGYVTARIADRDYLFHGFLIGVINSAWITLVGYKLGGGKISYILVSQFFIAILLSCFGAKFYEIRIKLRKNRENS